MSSETRSSGLEVHDVSKTYRLYAHPIDRLKEVALRRRLHQPFEPLANVSFVVPRGGVLGVIGENGAGKTTLLKIIAGTVTPTSGHVVRHGRVAALLELGAGFHPEFTGRQNIHLNATLLGLTNDEIRGREPSIIEFSELADFIDRPVKTYSAGMYVRLAFAIATSVDPDILVIDEALSVGDEHFQRKCIRRINEFRDAQKTILFCSHALYRVSELCDEVIWLAHGRVRRHGSPAEVINAYLTYLESKSAPLPSAESAPPPETAEVTVDEVNILDEHGRPLDRLPMAATIVFEIKSTCHVPSVHGHLGLVLLAADGRPAFSTLTNLSGLRPIVFTGKQTTRLRVPSFSLNCGTYSANAGIVDESGLRLIHKRASVSLEVKSDRPELGFVTMTHQWELPS